MKCSANVPPPFYPERNVFHNVPPQLLGRASGREKERERIEESIYYKRPRERLLATSRCAADTMPQSILLLAAEYPAPSPFSFYYNNRLTKRYMTRRSGWDESHSPQWRYFLSRESEQKRNHRKKASRLLQNNGMNEMSAIIEEAENLFRTSPEGGVKRNRPGKKVRQRQQQKLMLTKKGKEIVYSASPGRPPRKIMNTTITTDNDKN